MREVSRMENVIVRQLCPSMCFPRLDFLLCNATYISLILSLSRVVVWMVLCIVWGYVCCDTPVINPLMYRDLLNSVPAPTY